MTTISGGDIVAAVDLGGTKLLVAVADTAGHILAEDVSPTDPRGGVHVVRQIESAVRLATARVGLPGKALRCVAVGAPGAVDPATGRMAFAPNVTDLDGVDVREMLQTGLGTDVVLDNDVNMAVFGEHDRGHGRGRSDFVFVAVGTGIGMGILSQGRLLRGANGAAGEIGYLPLAGDPFSAYGRARGAFETAVAGGVIAERYGHRSGARRTVPEIFDRAAGANDPHAQYVLHEQARDLALGIAAVAAVLDPGLVVLGGGVGSRQELLEPTRAWLTRALASPPRLESSLLGHRACLIGAVVRATEIASAS
jgi:predicted NBD/HSP70 family sugar kinase